MTARKVIWKTVVLMLAFALALAGCAGGSGDVNTEQNSPAYVAQEDYQNYLEYYFPIVKASDGYYFFNSAYLYYFDTQSKEAYPVCNKPNCDHQGGGCMAYYSTLKYYPFMLSYYKNALYVWGWETNGANRHNYIYEISLDDYKVKKSAFLFDSTSSASIYFMIHRGYIYYIKDGGTDLKEQTAAVYRVKIGDTSTKREEEAIYEFSGIGAEIWALTASGNRLFVLNSAYGDTEGNGYATSYSTIDIHTLESKELVGSGAYSFFADADYAYYGKDENTICRIDLATGEETVFCETGGPCYISADSNYVYFDNLRAVHIDKAEEKDRKIAVYDKSGNYVTEVAAREADDECYFGGDDYMFFKDLSKNEVYALDKSQLASENRQFIYLQ